MPFYEIIYETGAYSVASYEDDEEAYAAVKAHNDRAVNGELGGPSGHPAERVARVLRYDEHPANFGESQAVPVDDVLKAVKSKAEGDLVSVPEAGAAMRDLVSAVVDSKPHESNFKMKEKAELKPTWKDGND